MTRKHFELVASALAHARDLAPGDAKVGVDITAAVLADVFASENPQFDRARFLAAAGV